MAALANDPELAQAITDGIVVLPEDDDRGPSLVEWDQKSVLLAAVCDRLDSVLLGVLAPHVKSLPDLKPYPRPRTAVGDALRGARMAARIKATRELVELLTPGDRPEWLFGTASNN